jgi:molybdate transport system substrate-binding protein
MRSISTLKESKTVVVMKPIVVFAAAATTAAMQDIAAMYEKQNGVKVQLNLASSATLAKQITAGADWDVFISANRQWMDYVVKHTSISADCTVNLLKDRLALIVPSDANTIVFSVKDSAFAKSFQGQLSLGDPASVPAGIYARQALEKLGWWNDLSDNVIPAVDVAAAQRYVETGQCQAGIVYLSGVKNSPKVKILHIFAPTLHDPIYFVDVAKPVSDGGKKFLEFLDNSTEAARIFKQHGFETVEPGG